jgi:hypothetical protein
MKEAKNYTTTTTTTKSVIRNKLRWARNETQFRNIELEISNVKNKKINDSNTEKKLKTIIIQLFQEEANT